MTISSITPKFIDNLPRPTKQAAKFFRHNEQAAGLSTSRFIQDFSVCLIPKITFARSVADLAENTFLDGSEEVLMYVVPAVLGQKIARPFFSKTLSEDLKKEVSKTGAELIEAAKKNSAIKASNTKVIPIKAAIALTAMAIPLTEFCLNYFKNLLTLKVFKTGDFKNIASLENNQEDKAQQEKVKKSAIKHIKLAGGIYAGCLGLAGLLATRGKNSKLLQNLSEFIVAPGCKLFKNSPKLKNYFNKYHCMDFNSQDGKLVMSKGQLTTCVLIGGCGYFGASADRGKENFKETATRFPLVGAYVITGSEFVEKGFKKLLHKFGKCKDILDKNLKVPSFDELEEVAKKLASKNKTNAQEEYKKLAKQKIMISGVPFIFSIGVMGFFVSGLTTYFTRKRFQNAQKSQEKRVNA